MWQVRHALDSGVKQVDEHVLGLSIPMHTDDNVASVSSSEGMRQLKQNAQEILNARWGASILKRGMENTAMIFWGMLIG